MHIPKIEETVIWKWGNGFAEGVVLEIKQDKTHIESKGSLITRNGTPENPAIIILHKSGSLVLKRASELITTSE